jgi:hypothetical protein
LDAANYGRDTSYGAFVGRLEESQRQLQTTEYIDPTVFHATVLAQMMIAFWLIWVESSLAGAGEGSNNSDATRPVSLVLLAGRLGRSGGNMRLIIEHSAFVMAGWVAFDVLFVIAWSRFHSARRRAEDHIKGMSILIGRNDDDVHSEVA